jgi:hypothetical protein
MLHKRILRFYMFHIPCINQMYKIFKISLCRIYHCSLTWTVIHYVYLLRTSSTALYSMYNNLLSSIILHLSVWWSFNCEFNQSYMIFLTVDWFQHIIIVIFFLFLPPWRWPREWLKHVGAYSVIKLHSYTHVHLLVFLNFYCKMFISAVIYVCCFLLVCQLPEVTQASRNVLKNRMNASRIVWQLKDLCFEDFTVPPNSGYGIYPRTSWSYHVCS